MRCYPHRILIRPVSLAAAALSLCGLFGCGDGAETQAPETGGVKPSRRAQQELLSQTSASPAEASLHRKDSRENQRNAGSSLSGSSLSGSSLSNSGKQSSEGTSRKLLERVRGLSPDDRSRTSWQDPFESRLWHCPGWRIADGDLQRNCPENRPATFLRPYREVNVEFVLRPPQRTGGLDGNDRSAGGEASSDSEGSPAETESVSETRGGSLNPIHPELRFFNPEDGSWIGIRCVGSEIRLVHHRNQSGKDEKLVKNVATGGRRTEGDGLRWRCTMTPNRILVAVDGRLALNAARPGSLLKSECLLQFFASPAGAALHDLRIEGR